MRMSLYSYLNLESTKTCLAPMGEAVKLYSYLNLESTKTGSSGRLSHIGCTVT